MEVSAIGTAVGASPSPQERGLNSLRTEDFFKILVTEMQNQDPFEPSDSADIINQVSQIRAIEQSSKLSETLGLLTQQQRVGAASQLIGKYVQAITTASDGSQMLQEGVVASVYFNADGSAVLELDSGEAVLATDVVRVTTLDEIEAILSEVDEEDESDDQGAAADKSDATRRQRDPDRSWLNLEGALRL